MKTERVLKIDHAINVLTNYFERIQETANEGELMEYLYPICSNDKDVDSLCCFENSRTLVELVVLIANPNVQEEIFKLDKLMGKDNLSKSIQLISKLIFFFDVMEGEQFQTMLKIEYLKMYRDRCEWSNGTIDYETDKAARKLSSLQ